MGKLDEAVACFCRASDLRPGYAAAHNNLAMPFGSSGKLPKPSLPTAAPWNFNRTLPWRAATWVLPSRSKECWLRRSPPASVPWS